VTSSAHTVLGYLYAILSRPRDGQDGDRELLHRFAEARDGDAFATLMQRHGPMVLGLARRVVGDEQLAEDVFQATFLMLSRKVHTIRRAESLSCWLHGVAFRFALRARRSRQRRQERETHVHRSSPPTPLDELTAQELLAVLDEELHQLPENYRAVLILCCLEGLSQEEAAKHLGCSAGAVKGRLERGRNRLRLRLEKRGLTLPAVLGGTLLLAGSTRAVPAALLQTTLQAATTGVGVTPAAVALIQEVMRSMVVHKLKAIGAAVLLLALSGTGVGMMALRPQAGKENKPLTASADKPLSAKKRIDLYGDTLPEGAVMRLGTLKRRAVGVKLAVTADGKSIIGTRGTHLSIWDAATGELRQQCELSEPWGDAIPSPDGRWLAQWRGWQGALAIWDVRTVEKVRVLGTEGERSYWPIAFSRDSKRVAAIGSRQDKKSGYDHLICAWNLTDGKELFRTELRNKRPGSRLAFSPDGNRLLAKFSSSTSDRGLYCWDIAAGRQAWLNEVISPESMVFTADGKVLTSPGGQILDLATGRTVKLENPPPIPLKDKGGVIYFTDLQLAMTPDSRTLLIPRPDGVIAWDMIHGKQLHML
jgi:RNA polymerase sigma factor (sigma-70 family)